MDTEFIRATESWLTHLQADHLVSSFRITRRKLGLGPADLGEFHLMLELDGLAQLDEAFKTVSSRTDPTETFHYAVNSKVQNVRFALYRDFPDEHRHVGEEKF
ncbi:MAG: DUF6614 family protein [Pseudomonadota bacterium]